MRHLPRPTLLAAGAEEGGPLLRFWGHGVRGRRTVAAETDSAASHTDDETEALAFSGPWRELFCQLGQMHCHDGGGAPHQDAARPQTVDARMSVDLRAGGRARCHLCLSGVLVWPLIFSSFSCDRSWSHHELHERRFTDGRPGP